MVSEACPQINLTFDDSAVDFVLDTFGLATDKEGFIVNKERPNERALTFEGQEIKKTELGGLQDGSISIIKDNLVSLMRLASEA